MSEIFTLHPKLKADAAFVRDFPLSRVLLMNDARFPWLLLVPRRPNVTELHELGECDRAALTQEIVHAGEILQSWARLRGGCDKLNIAMIGNMVPQLHVHIIARRKTDPLWPDAVWGRGDPVRYVADELKSVTAELAGRFDPQ